METEQQRHMGRNRRKNIPTPTKQQVLMEAGYRCGNPGCGHILTLEIHHIEWVKDGGGNEASNLLALCPNCHELHTKGHIPLEAIRHWKGMLLALNHAFDREGIDLLLYLHRTRAYVEPLRYSADGVLKFARLIASELVEFTNPRGNRSHTIGGVDSPSIHQLGLSETGTLLIEAWLAGDEEKYLCLLTRSRGVT